jgi:hypothetical protein
MVRNLSLFNDDCKVVKKRVTIHLSFLEAPQIVEIGSK